MRRIGIVTCYLDNFGACLQAYAISRVISELGYECKIINYSPDRDINNPDNLHALISGLQHVIKRVRHKNYKYELSRHRKFDAFRKEHLKFDARYFKDFSELSSYPPDYDAFVVGSDQLWNPLIHNHSNNRAYFLDFVPTGIKRIAYAPSIGLSILPTEYKNEMRELLQKFDTLSVRESAGAKIVTELTGRDCQVVLDPTLLLPARSWETITSEVSIPEPYIFCYLFGKQEYIGEFVQYAAQKTGLQVVVIPFTQREYESNYVKVENAGPSEFVSLIRNASLVITDSFHATAFSINLNVPFYSLLRNSNTDANNMNSRITEVLTTTRHMDRLIRSNSDFPEIIQTDIDFNESNKILLEKRNHDKATLLSAIGE